MRYVGESIQVDDVVMVVGADGYWRVDYVSDEAGVVGLRGVPGAYLQLAPSQIRFVRRWQPPGPPFAFEWEPSRRDVLQPNGPHPAAPHNPACAGCDRCDPHRHVREHLARAAR